MSYLSFLAQLLPPPPALQRLEEKALASIFHVLFLAVPREAWPNLEDALLHDHASRSCKAAIPNTA